MGGVDADGRREDAGISLSLGQARAGLDVGVERDRDCGEDADDRDDDHQLDEGEASLLVPTAKDVHGCGSCHERLKSQ
jgi:hypothetical protein